MKRNFFVLLVSAVLFSCCYSCGGGSDDPVDRPPARGPGPTPKPEPAPIGPDSPGPSPVDSPDNGGGSDGHNNPTNDNSGTSQNDDVHPANNNRQHHQSGTVCIPPADTAIVLTVPFYGQEASQWCWAACTQMCVEYIGGLKLPQCNQANDRHRTNNCCAGKTTLACNQPAWPYFDRYGFRANEHNGAMSWNEIKKEIYCYSRPILFSWRNGNSRPRSGHMMLVFGYSEQAINGTVQKYLYIYDSQYRLDNMNDGIGGALMITYDNFVHSSAGRTHWKDFYQIHQQTAAQR